MRPNSRLQMPFRTPLCELALCIGACGTSGDGLGGHDDGGPFVLSWPPTGSGWPISDTSAAQASLNPDVAGAYRVELRVTDSEGAQNDLDFLNIEVVEP